MDFEHLKIRLGEEQTPPNPWQTYRDSPEFATKLQTLGERFDTACDYLEDHPGVTVLKMAGDVYVAGFHILSGWEISDLQKVDARFFADYYADDGALPCLRVAVAKGLGCFCAATYVTFATPDDNQYYLSGSCDPYSETWEWVGQSDSMTAWKERLYAPNATANLHPDEQLRHIEAALDIVIRTPLLRYIP